MNTVINADCLDILPSFPDGTIDLAICDPPFNVGKEYEEDIPDRDYYAWCNDWIDAVYRVLAPNGAIFLMTIPRHVGQMMSKLDSLMQFRNLITWHNSSMPVKDRFCQGYQPICYYVKGSAFTFNYGIQKRASNAVLPYGRENKAGSIKDIWDDIPFISGGCMASKEAILEDGAKRKAHPAQMPLALAERMILYTTNLGDTVLDPFLGSGTSAEAAIKTGRNFIGIEKNAKYHGLIKQRIANMQPSLLESN